MLYEELQEEANADGLFVKEKSLIGSDGLICGNKIAIRQDMPIIKKDVPWQRSLDITILHMVILLIRIL